MVLDGGSVAKGTSNIGGFATHHQRASEAGQIPAQGQGHRLRSGLQAGALVMSAQPGPQNPGTHLYTPIYSPRPGDQAPTGRVTTV